MMSGKRFLQSGIGVNHRVDHGPCFDLRPEGEALGAGRLKQGRGGDAEFVEFGLKGFNFGFRYAPDQVCLNVLRFRVGRIVRIPPDVQVAIVFLDDVVDRDQAAVLVELDPI